MKKTIIYSITAATLLLTILAFIFTCIKKNSLQVNLSNFSDLNIPPDTVSPPQDPNINLSSPLPWNLILVSAASPLQATYKTRLTQLRNGQAVDERIYPDLQTMMDAARAEGLNPLICSSYRTIEKQKTLFQNKVNSYLSQGYSNAQAENEAAKWVARPGTSEHHTGLAVDIVSMDYQLLDEAQENTPEQQWLMQNSYKYGFILRYPNDKSGITGIYYEPWHYRYVGKEAAREIYEQGICLEEYLQNLQE